MKYKLEDHQLKAQESIEHCDRCLLEMSMRSGKTLTVIDYISKKKFKKILYVVNNSNTRDESLPNEFKKFGLESILKNTTISHYRSLKKYSNKSFDIIILDEVQDITPNIVATIKTMSFKKLIGMTGTVPTKQEKQDLLFQYLGLSKVFKYSVDEAVSDKAVSDYTITVLNIPLDSSKNIEVKTKTHHFYTSEANSYAYLSSQIHSEYNVNKKKLLALSRMRLLNTANSKINYIHKYIADNKDKRVLIFVETREIAEKFEYFYHGTSTNKHYKDFQSEKIPYLVLVNKGSVGDTYQNLDGCLLTCVNSSNTIIQQKIFRTI